MAKKKYLPHQILPNPMRPVQERTISFGKFKGRRYGEVPIDYLEWFVLNSYDQMVNRTKWAQEELKRRKTKSGA